jgi:hypothetical protein
MTTRRNPLPAAHNICLPRFPLGSPREFEHHVCAPSASAAKFGESAMRLHRIWIAIAALAGVPVAGMGLLLAVPAAMDGSPAALLLLAPTQSRITE